MDQLKLPDRPMTAAEITTIRRYAEQHPNQSILRSVLLTYDAAVGERNALYWLLESIVTQAKETSADYENVFVNVSQSWIRSAETALLLIATPSATEQERPDARP